jgi:hypothetical protein
MLALHALYAMLGTFRYLFARHTPWVLFCMVMLGFIGTPHLEGLSSLCRFWRLDEAGYYRLAHFFHSSAWYLDGLIIHWSHLVLHQQVAVTVQGRAVLLGDHTSVVKDARRMPGVVTLHHNSETQSKPSYFRGHYWGVIGLLVGSLAEAFCLPLEARLHQGFAHLDPEQSSAPDHDTQCVQLVQMALDFVRRHDTPAILVLDAFFAVSTVFVLANSLWSVAFKQPALFILTRAKKNYVAYHEPHAPATRSPGRPRKYGDKIKLSEVFVTYQAQFLSAPCQVYGRVETISYLALNLVWKPIKGPLRFIFAITSRGPIVLMCRDLTIEPLMAIALYCARVRIETMFAMLKNMLGTFAYRFWSKYVPRHSRQPKKNAALKHPQAQHLPAVHSTWEACERFVMLGCITLGMLQLIALKFPGQVWTAYTEFLRTRSRAVPSERTAKAVLAQALLHDFHHVTPSVMMYAIHHLAHPSHEDEEQGATTTMETPYAAWTLADNPLFLSGLCHGQTHGV